MWTFEFKHWLVFPEHILLLSPLPIVWKQFGDGPSGVRSGSRAAGQATSPVLDPLQGSSRKTHLIWREESPKDKLYAAYIPADQDVSGRGRMAGGVWVCNAIIRVPLPV